jgi:hypothetical protein
MGPSNESRRTVGNPSQTCYAPTAIYIITSHTSAVGVPRSAAVLSGGVLPWGGAPARSEPALKVGLEDADAALADLHLLRARPFGEHALQRAADDTRPICGLIKAENLHVCDLVVLGRLVFFARRKTSYARSTLPA